MLRRAFPLATVLLMGCWLDGDEWAIKRYEAGLLGAEEPSGSGGPDLGLGTCVQELFEGQADGVTLEAVSGLQPSCGQGEGPEVALAWEVREEGCWVVSTRGSAFSPVLYGQESCSGASLFCTEENVAIVDLDVGPVLLVVDGYQSSDIGEWNLQTSPLITQDLGTDVSATGDTSGRPTWEDSGCGAERVGAAEYLRFTPPRAGLWTFVLDAPFDAVLSVHEPCDFRANLTCANGTSQGGESVREQLDALQEVIVRVGGVWRPGDQQAEQGTWSLTISSD